MIFSKVSTKFTGKLSDIMFGTKTIRKLSKIIVDAAHHAASLRVLFILGW